MLQTKKIETLTQEQIDKFPSYIKKWTDIGLCTEPANRIEAEKAILESYKLGGLNPPKKIVWCGSPLSQGLVRAIILDKNLIENRGASVGDSVGASVRDSVWASVRDSVGDSVWDSVWDSVGDSVRDSVWASVWDSVGDSVGASVRDSVGDSVGDSGYGQHDANWLAFYEYFKNELGLIDQTKKLNGLIELAKHAGWFLPHENICWVSERHYILNRDDRGRLHSLDQPAVAYPDGWAIYAVHGVRVPEYIILRPQEITVEKIESENNIEIRRVMIDKFGLENYLQKSNAKLINKDKDQHGRERILYRKEQNNDEPIVMVKVINSTPEPDGSFKNYFLRVPPNIKTAQAAVAWSFGESSENYKPLIES